jgi:anti-anti-sigma factor
VDIVAEQQGETIRLRLAGELDLSTADAFRTAGLGALDDPGAQRLLIDMSGVQFIDSTGVGVLVELRNAAQPLGRALVIAEPSDRVREVLQLTALDGVFDIAPPHGSRDQVNA